MSNVRSLNRKEIFAPLAIHVPAVKSQYFSLQILLNEQRGKTSSDTFEEDIKRLEKVAHCLESTVREIKRVLHNLEQFKCPTCPKERFCDGCQII